jgi:hypothetical protein
MDLDIEIKRPDKTYRPGEKVTGVVIINSKTGGTHQGIKLQVEGR